MLINLQFPFVSPVTLFHQKLICILSCENSAKGKSLYKEECLDQLQYEAVATIVARMCQLPVPEMPVLRCLQCPGDLEDPVLGSSEGLRDFYMKRILKFPPSQPMD